MSEKTGAMLTGKIRMEKFCAFGVRVEGVGCGVEGVGFRLRVEGVGCWV